MTRVSWLMAMFSSPDRYFNHLLGINNILEFKEMNRIFLLLVLFTISFTTLGKSKYAEGYIVTLEQDTIFGRIKIKVDKEDVFLPSKVEDKIVFVPDGGKRTAYLPGSIRYFSFFYNFETLIYASVPYFNGQLFMKVISENGFLKLYQFYPDEEKGLANAYELAEFVYAADFNTIRFFYILKPDGEFLFLGRHTPRNKILSFFGDDPELAEKIGSREYKYTDVYRMVREYNSHKAANPE